jgi:hypothetical protein
MIKASRAGIAPTALRPLVDNFAGYISTREFRLADGTLARNRPQPSTLWLDDLYMSVPALGQMGKLTGERRYFDDATKQVLQFSEDVQPRPRPLRCTVGSRAWRSTPSSPGPGPTRALATLVEAEVLPEDHPDRRAVIDLLNAHVRGLAPPVPDGLLGISSWTGTTPTSRPRPRRSTRSRWRAINRGPHRPRGLARRPLSLGTPSRRRSTHRARSRAPASARAWASSPPSTTTVRTSPFAAHGYGPVLLAGAEMVRLLKTHRFEISDSSVQLYR